MSLSLSQAMKGARASRPRGSVVSPSGGGGPRSLRRGIARHYVWAARGDPGNTAFRALFAFLVDNRGPRHPRNRPARGPRHPRDFALGPPRGLRRTERRRGYQAGQEARAVVALAGPGKLVDEARAGPVQEHELELGQ